MKFWRRATSRAAPALLLLPVLARVGCAEHAFIGALDGRKERSGSGPSSRDQRISTRFRVNQSADPAPSESSVSPEVHRTKCRHPPLDIFMSVTTPFIHFLDFANETCQSRVGRVLDDGLDDGLVNREG